MLYDHERMGECRETPSDKLLERPSEKYRKHGSRLSRSWWEVLHCELSFNIARVTKGMEALSPGQDRKLGAVSHRLRLSWRESCRGVWPDFLGCGISEVTLSQSGLTRTPLTPSQGGLLRGSPGPACVLRAPAQASPFQLPQASVFPFLRQGECVNKQMMNLPLGPASSALGTQGFWA